MGNVDGGGGWMGVGDMTYFLKKEGVATERGVGLEISGTVPFTNHMQHIFLF